MTFKNAEALRQVAKTVPLDRLLVETDAPYLAPMPMRGKRNEPSFVRHTATYVADMLGLPFDALAARTTANFDTQMPMVGALEILFRRRNADSAVTTADLGLRRRVVVAPNGISRILATPRFSTDPI